MNRSIVLCGLGRVGWRVLESLRAAGWSIAIVDLHADPTDERLSGLPFFRGDCRNAKLLDQAGVATAFGVLIVTSDDLVNVSTALHVRRVNPTARIVVRMFNQNLITRLSGAVKNTIALSVSALTAPLMALAAVTGDTLAAFNIGDQPQQFVEIAVDSDSSLLGERITTLAAKRNLIVVGHTTTVGRVKLWTEIDGEHKLTPGDRIVVCGSPKTLGPLLNTGGEGQSGVLWAGGVRRIARMLRRTLGAIDLPVKIATGILFTTLLGSTAVFRYGVGTSWGDAIYQTVSVVATGSELHGEGQPEWVKAFLGILKIVGTALIAGFTAIFTNYLLKARLGGALESRRIPEGGHVVVCGLGNIGFRCVSELVRLGHPVVAIEKANDSPFAATVRRMGVAVVVGDATVTEVLRQARVETARAVIATTSMELANLEIALLVRELNLTQRIVVRLSDPDFAQAAREAANIKLAVSPPALASSAFAAALYGDTVQALAAVSGQSLAILELVVTEDDVGFVDRGLLELMIDYRFLPLGLAGQPPFAERGIPQGYRLKLGDRLTIALERDDLERLLRRESPKRGWSVVLDSLPITAGPELTTLVRTLRNCDAEEAQSLLQNFPCELAQNLSQGQAEEIVARLRRERATARVVPAA